MAPDKSGCSRYENTLTHDSFSLVCKVGPYTTTTGKRQMRAWYTFLELFFFYRCNTSGNLRAPTTRRG